ncbi:MAG: hypothetical protein CSA47_00815 [Gammaproteobacteria bacterium]|nr:MAG: hypothetical protein CSA47_00815 [Gammaproteobacteria bacterium]
MLTITLTPTLSQRGEGDKASAGKALYQKLIHSAIFISELIGVIVFLAVGLLNFFNKIWCLIQYF